MRFTIALPSRCTCTAGTTGTSEPRRLSCRTPQRSELTSSFAAVDTLATVITMRSVYIVILAVLALLCNDALAATSKTDLAEAELTKNERNRSLRGEVIADEDSYAIDEERVQTSGISKVAKELKLKKENLKKVSVALEKAKGNPSKLAVSAKKMKAIAEKKILAKLSSMENDNFVRLFKANFTPQRAKSTGRIKNPEQFAKYEEFYKLAKLVGLK